MQHLTIRKTIENPRQSYNLITSENPESRADSPSALSVQLESTTSSRRLIPVARLLTASPSCYYAKSSTCQTKVSNFKTQCRLWPSFLIVDSEQFRIISLSCHWKSSHRRNFPLQLSGNLIFRSSQREHFPLREFLKQTGTSGKSSFPA